jgi:hypothetical protein
MRTSKRCVAAIMIGLLILPSIAMAAPGDKVSSMDKGDRAPFDGLLMNRQLADRVEAEKKTKVDKKVAKAELTAAVARSKNDAKRDMAIQVGRYSALKEMHLQTVKVKDDQIEFLRKNYLPKPWYESATFLMVVGALFGGGVVIGGAHVVKTVR